MDHKLLVHIIFFTLVLVSCSPQSQEKEHPTEAHEPSHETDNGEEVALTRLQFEKIGVELGTFQRKEIGTGVKANGTIAAPPQDIAIVSSLISGRIRKIRAKPDQFVKKGTILATLESTELIEWQKDYQILGSQLKYLEKDLARKKEMLEQEVIGPKELEQLESEINTISTKRKALSNKLRLLSLDPDLNPGSISSVIGIRSPIQGFVDQININTGLYIQPNKQLFTVVNNQHLHLELKVFESDLAAIRIGQSVNFALQSASSSRMKAHIVSIGKTLNETEKTISIHADIDDVQPYLLPGMFVEAQILTKKNAVDALPESAIALDKGLEYIFVKEEEHEDEIHFMKIPIISHAKEMGFAHVEVLEKIAPNSEIVTKGAFYLMAQSKLGETEAGHHH